MNKTTTRDLLFYAYNETDLKDADRIQRSIDGDPLVQNEYNELLSTLSLLDHGPLKPRESTLRKIHEFAQSQK